MANVDHFVQVTVSKTSASVTRQGFSTPLGVFQVDASIIPTRYASYTSTSEMTVAGFATTDPAFLWAQTVFGQERSPISLAIGRRLDGDAQVDTVTIATADSGLWQVVIDGVTYDHTGGTGDEQAIAEGLRDAIVASEASTSSDGNAVVVQSGALPGGAFTVTAWVAGEPFVNGGIVVPGSGSGTFLNTTASQTVFDKSGENLTATLDAIIVENDEWYGLTVESRQSTDILLANTWVAGQTKVFVASSSGQDVLGTSGTDLASNLAATNNKRTQHMWYHRPKDFADGAMIGRAMAFDLDAAGGAGTWAAKQLQVIVTSPLTSAELANLEANGSDAHVFTKGRGVVWTGKSVEGEFMDIQTTLDWAQSRIGEDVFAAIATTPTKVPYDDSGIATIKAQVLGVLKLGVTNGHFTADNPLFPRVTVPRSVNVSTADKNSRTLRNVLGEAILAGAIHNVIVQVNVQA